MGLVGAMIAVAALGVADQGFDHVPGGPDPAVEQQRLELGVPAAVENPLADEIDDRTQKPGIRFLKGLCAAAMSARLEMRGLAMDIDPPEEPDLPPPPSPRRDDGR